MCTYDLITAWRMLAEQLANIISTIDEHLSIADQGTNNYTYKNILQLLVNVYIKFVIVYECFNNVP